jgi:hypothetical protein
MGIGRPPPVDLEGVRWAGVTGPYCCFGQAFSIRSTSQQLADYLGALYAPMLCDHSPSHVTFSLVAPEGSDYGAIYRDRAPLVASAVPSSVFGTLLWAINRHVIQPSTEAVVLHAAAADLDGYAVVLPAAMESGKTTLVTGLLERGLGYLTDEAVELGPDRRVTGFPKPLSIDPGSWEVLAHLRPQVCPEVRPYLEHQWQIPAGSLSYVVAESRAAVFIFPRYLAGAATELVRVPPATALRLAVGCTFGVDGAVVSASQVQQLRGVLTRVPTYQLTSSSLREACETVIETLQDASQGPAA